jgi:hypothetical protein
VRTFFSNDIAQKQVNGKNLSLALADFSSFNFYRSRSGLNLLMIMLFGEKARMINFTEGDRQLEKTIQEIRRVVFEIIEERINGKGKDQQDFMNLYRPRKPERIPPKFIGSPRRISFSNYYHSISQALTQLVI